MSDYIRVFCRSSRLIALTEITEFIKDGVYFEEEPRFDPPLSDVEGDWQRLTVFYQPEKRPIVLHKNAGDPLMHEEIAEISAGSAEGLHRRLQETAQTITIEIHLSALTEEAWEMLDSLEAYLARTYDGIVSVDGEGFYDAALHWITK